MKTQGLHNQLVEWRHDLHMHPQISFEEEFASNKVAHLLKDFGIEVHQGIAKTGVVGVLKKGTSNKSIGIRADMDALPINEINTFSYKSTIENRMHACGHDGHTTMINSLVKGHSGVHPDVLKQLIAFLNNDIVPFVPRIGSLGASGDLAPLSHMALALIGEGMVLDEHDSPVPTDGVLKEHGLIGIGLRAKDGLSLINGTSQMLAFMTIAERRLNSLLPLAYIILCTSM